MPSAAPATLLQLPFAPPVEIGAVGVLAEMLAEIGRGRGPGLHLGGQMSSVTELDKAWAVPLWSLLDQDGQGLITCVYEEVLGRPPDLTAITHYEAKLATGAVSKIEFIGTIRYSAEGRKVNRKVTGLLPRYLLRRAYHVPVLGRFARLAVAIMRLPRMTVELQQVTRTMADTQARLDKLERQAGNGSALLTRLQQAEAKLGAVEASRQTTRRG